MHTEFFFIVLAVLSAAGLLLWFFVAYQSCRFDEKYGSESSVPTHVDEASGEDRSRGERLAALANSDVLTGLLTRPAFLAAAKEASNSENGEAGKLAVVVADIDQLKKLNDSYGHMAGDTVLRAVGEIVAANVHKQENEKAARFGGDEFAILLREFDEEALRGRLEELRRAVELQNVIFENQRIHVTMSCGAALFLDSDRDISDAIDRADRALHEAKSQGRNRVSIAAAPADPSVEYAA